MTDTARDLRENYPAVDVTAVVFSRDFADVGCCIIPQDRVLAIADEIERLQDFEKWARVWHDTCETVMTLLGLPPGGSPQEMLAQVQELAAGTGPASNEAPLVQKEEPHQFVPCTEDGAYGQFCDVCGYGPYEALKHIQRWEDKREGKTADAVDSAPSDCTTVSDGRLSRGNANVGDRIGRTRRPAHPMDTISGGPIGPSDPTRNVIIEACANVALEQRCERGTPWDLACTTIAEKIRALSVTSQDRKVAP